MTSRKNIKHCFVPCCKNTSFSAMSANKAFFLVPKRSDLVTSWCNAVGYSDVRIGPLYCCSDHFQEGNMYYYRPESKDPKLRLKAGVLPSVSLVSPKSDAGQSADCHLHLPQGTFYSESRMSTSAADAVFKNDVPDDSSVGDRLGPQEQDVASESQQQHYDNFFQQVPLQNEHLQPSLVVVKQEVDMSAYEEVEDKWIILATEDSIQDHRNALCITEEERKSSWISCTDGGALQEGVQDLSILKQEAVEEVCKGVIKSEPSLPNDEPEETCGSHRSKIINKNIPNYQQHSVAEAEQEQCSNSVQNVKVKDEPVAWQNLVVIKQEPDMSFPVVVKEEGGTELMNYTEVILPDEGVKKSASKERNFSCSQCSKRFAKKYDLNRHFKTHTGERNFPCNLCKKRFLTNSQLTYHLKAHSGERNFSCTECFKRFITKYELNRHFNTHTAEKHFCCNLCPKRFPTNSQLTYHLKAHSEESNFNCNVCAKRCFRKYELTRHIKTHTGERNFACNLCAKRFITNCQLTYHSKTHSEERNLSCTVCSKRFLTKHDLTQHLEIHAGEEKKFNCDLCKKGFIRKTHLLCHVKTHSVVKNCEENNFSCDLCTKRFRTENSLAYHLKIHSGERNFNCTVCSKRFILKAELKQHLKVHTGERRYGCDLCPKRFLTKTQLTFHSKSHSGERNFVCTVCSKRFFSKYYLSIHLKIHTGEKNFKCDLCAKCFLTNSQLTYHLKAHSGERNFSCTVCSKSFITKYELTQHFKTHSGERNFSCDLCSKRFTRKSHLLGHVKRYSEGSLNCVAIGQNVTFKA